MDIKEIVRSIFNQENLAKMTEKTGLEGGEVKNVLGKAMPFLANTDNKDKGEEEAIRAISEEAGVPEGETKSILSSALPLLMGMMGGGESNTTEASADTGMMGMFSGLLGGLDMSDMLGGLFGGSDEQELTVEAAPTVDQAFQPVQEAVEEVQEAAEEAEKPGGLLGMLGSLFGKNK